MDGTKNYFIKVPDIFAKLDGVYKAQEIAVWLKLHECAAGEIIVVPQALATKFSGNANSGLSNRAARIKETLLWMEREGYISILGDHNSYLMCMAGKKMDGGGQIMCTQQEILHLYNNLFGRDLEVAASNVIKVFLLISKRMYRRTRDNDMTSAGVAFINEEKAAAEIGISKRTLVKAINCLCLIDSIRIKRRGSVLLVTSPVYYKDPELELERGEAKLGEAI